MNTVNCFINGQSVRYLHIENIGKPKLVFLMGALQDIETIRVFNQGFSDDFDYWAVEVPGSGRTPPLPASVPVASVANIFAQFAEEYIADAFTIVACSYATAIAVEYAKSPRSLAEALVLAGSMYTIPKRFWPTMFELMRDCLIDKPAFASGFLDLLLADRPEVPRADSIRRLTLRKIERYRSEAGANADDSALHFIYNTLRLMTYDAGDLSNIHIPALVMVGEYDPYVEPHLALDLANRLPNSDFQLIANCDHMFHLQAPHEAIGMAKNWLSSRIEEVAITKVA